MGTIDSTHLRPFVALEGVSKRFGGVHALEDVSLEIHPGTIHGLVGENGAGKSTLGKIIAGVHQPDAGTMRLEGREERFHAPRDALKLGVTMIAQEISLLPNRSVVENVFLGSQGGPLALHRQGAQRERYARLVEEAGFHVPADALVGGLRVAEQKKVEILRALARNARLIVMDEPTAALTTDEAEKLFEIVRALRANGKTVVYVSHFLKEVLALVDDVTVLKDGRLVRTGAAAGETPATLVKAMLGRSLDLAFPEKPDLAADAPTVCRVSNLTRGRMVRDVSFLIRRGEILGLAGLIGSGRTELARCIFGADRLERGTVELDGQTVTVRSPRQAIARGIAYLPESRKEQGLVMRRPVRDNISLAHASDVASLGVIRRRREAERTAELRRVVDVRGGRAGSPVTDLSGGNQQKVLFAKWLFRQPKLFIADEPTLGVDVGAKQAIYQLIVSLAERGMAVLLISSEMEEVLGLAHRVLVMRDGAVVAELQGDAMTENRVMHATFGTDPTAETRTER